MAIILLESGSDATQGLEWWDSSTGTCATATDQAKTGPRSIKCTTSGAGAASRLAIAGVGASTGRRYTGYFRFSALPTSAVAFNNMQTSGFGGNVVNLRLKSDGTIEVLNAAVVIKTGTAVLSTNTWYRIAVAFVITSTTNYTIKVWVNGTLDINAVGGVDPALTNTAAADLLVGWITASQGNNVSVWVDDFYMDDSNALTDPGDVRVVYKAPTTVNANNFDTATGTGAVNERPLSATNAKRHNATTSVRQNYLIQDIAAGDVSCIPGTLVGYGGFIWAKRVGAVGTGTSKITVNGSDTAVTLTTSDALFTNYTAGSTYPTNAETIGMVSTNNGDDTVLEDCGMLIAFIPGTQSLSGWLPLLGVGS